MPRPAADEQAAAARRAADDTADDTVVAAAGSLIAPQTSQKSTRFGAADLADDSGSESPERRGAMTRQRILEQQRAAMGAASWNDMRERIATGCENDYFTRSTGSIRVEFHMSHEETDMDPINVMKEGVMVLSYDQGDAIFERKLLKVDDQLRFLYIMDGQAQVAAIKQRGAAPLVSVPLSHIKHIYTMDEAVHICEENGVSTESLGFDSTFVMWVEQPTSDNAKVPEIDEEMPPLEKVFIFVAAPQQQLRRCIHACKDFTEGNASQAKESLRRVDQVALQDWEELLDKDAPDFKFDISFRNESSLRTVAIFSDSCDKPDMGGLTIKLQQELLPVDYHRVSFVLQDSILLRRNTMSLTTDMLKRGITKFVRDWTHIAGPLPDGASLPEAVEEATSLARSLSANTTQDGPLGADCHYQEASSRATLSALKHMFELERDFVALINDGQKKEDGSEVGEQSDDSDVSEVTHRLHHGTNAKTRWRCENCRYINDASIQECEVCGALREVATESRGPAPKAKAKADATFDMKGLATRDADTARSAQGETLQLDGGAAPSLAAEGALAPPADFDFKGLEQPAGAAAEASEAPTSAPRQTGEAEGIAPTAPKNEAGLPCFTPRTAATRKRGPRRDGQGVMACAGPGGGNCQQQ